MASSTGAWKWPENLSERMTSSTQPPIPEPKPEPGPRRRRRQKHWKPRTCRICLDTEQPKMQFPDTNFPSLLQSSAKVVYESESGRLISPCRCKGSIKYVHDQCLQQWRIASPSLGSQNVFVCETCGFKYRLSRLRWASTINSTTTQLGITLTVLAVTVFLLGFIADPIISTYFDPFRSFTRIFRPSTWSSLVWESDGTWSGHFFKGFASLCLASVFKALLASPFEWFFRYGVGNRRRNRRIQREDLSWILIVIGAATFLFATWKLVRKWSAWLTARASGAVIDIQSEGDDSDDDDDDDGNEHEHHQ